MTDICTLIVALTMNAVPCQAEKSCDPTIDGKRQICVTFCRPAPNTYDCERSDGSKYFWKPRPGEDVTLRNANGFAPAMITNQKDNQ